MPGLIGLIGFLAALLIVFFILLMSSRKREGIVRKELDQTKRALKEVEKPTFDAETYKTHEIEKMMLRIENEEARMRAEIAEKATEAKKMLYEDIEVDRAAKIAELESELQNQRQERTKELEDTVREKSVNVEERLKQIDKEFEEKSLQYETQIHEIKSQVEQ